MYTAEAFEYDEIGKIDLTNIYDRPDPRSYYTTLRRLKYMIPETAKPVFQNVIEAYRSIRNKRKVRIVDVGCSYGINDAMLKGDLEMDQLYSLYTAEGTKTARKDQLLARDRSFMNDVVKDEDLEVVGLDASASAIKYAVEAKLLDDGVAADLETAPPSPEVAAVLDDTDLVISTGCIGYVGEDTLKNLIDVNAPRKPWMVHFVLRMFPFEGIQRVLGPMGYVTEKIRDQTFLQRRFASQDERSHVLQRLDELGIDPTGLESEGWYHAEAFISRPAEERSHLPVNAVEVLR